MQRRMRYCTLVSKQSEGLLQMNTYVGRVEVPVEVPAGAAVEMPAAGAAALG